jgi:hypothetical protein
MTPPVSVILTLLPALGLSGWTLSVVGIAWTYNGFARVDFASL